MREGRNQYAPGWGVPELRTAIAHHQKRFYDLDVDPDSEVLVTTGATEAIAATLLALVEPGDEVVALEPYYDSYAACIAMAGGRRVPVTLRAPDFRLDVDALRAAVTPRTKLLLINSPHNPTGTVLTRDELQAVADVAIEHDLVVVTDEVYEHLTFDDVVHHPLAAYDGMRDRTITVSSGGKTFSFTGWKVGWAVGPATVGPRGDDGQAVPDVHLRSAVAARDRDGPGPRRRLLRDLHARRSRPSATGSAQACPTSGSTCSSPRAPTS